MIRIPSSRPQEQAHSTEFDIPVYHNANLLEASQQFELAEGGRIMAECNFRDHLWDPQSNRRPFKDEVTLACAICGVGHRVVFDKRVPGRVTTALTIFPSTGSRTISRNVIRWSILSHEANLSDIRETGVEVIEEPSTIEGVAVGD